MLCALIVSQAVGAGARTVSLVSLAPGTAGPMQCEGRVSVACSKLYFLLFF